VRPKLGVGSRRHLCSSQPSSLLCHGKSVAIPPAGGQDGARAGVGGGRLADRFFCSIVLGLLLCQ